MSVRRDNPSVSASARTEFDHRALEVVAHLLNTGIWLEHRLSVIPMPRATAAHWFGWVCSAFPQLRSVSSPFGQITRHRTSLTAQLAAITQ